MIFKPYYLIFYVVPWNLCCAVNSHTSFENLLLKILPPSMILYIYCKVFIISLMIIYCRLFYFFCKDFSLIFNPDFKLQSIYITWILLQVQDSTYTSFTFIDLSYHSANQPVKNLILHSFKHAPLKDSLELIGSLSLKRTQGNVMAEVKKLPANSRDVFRIHLSQS